MNSHRTANRISEMTPNALYLMGPDYNPVPLCPLSKPISLFEDMQEDTIVDMISVNTTSVLRIIKHFYGSIHSRKPFYTAVMVSIAGYMSSPFFSVYGASKAALKIFIESVNVELKKSGTDNRILKTSSYSGINKSFRLFIWYIISSANGYNKERLLAPL